MTDRELLELAAKAAELSSLVWCEQWRAMAQKRDQGGFIFQSYWNPLTDDGDAFRLAVKLGLAISIDTVERETWAHHEQVTMSSREWWPAHPTSDGGSENGYAATRRAIVRAAAEIGRSNDVHKT